MELRGLVLEEVIRVYEAYVEDFRRRDKDRKPFEGVFGFHGGPQDYPCHEKFMQDLGEKLKELQSRPIDPVEVAEILRFIYCVAPVRWESEATVYWMLLAAHSLTLELIPKLDTAGARTLYDEYMKQYPRRKRLPVQVKVLDALKRQTKGK